MDEKQQNIIKDEIVQRGNQYEGRYDHPCWCKKTNNAKGLCDSSHLKLQGQEFLDALNLFLTDEDFANAPRPRPPVQPRRTDNRRRGRMPFRLRRNRTQ
ncbi:MAG: hypothetical protein COT81_05325 [Candidatus Buchananbacteria bacterium CG10_big_fil_rev_8_21_14_0_10_42_9]|uniref:Uncharacterized protein n=1 Tax=Candidatus Buchananbacteria bacterium CG10_big_fil_rev_8_21_14_0_10_42_9 TaxID=1974526 RepID=A0A2H0VZZ0_9BACT|nr:MAG: hypothetical protein COT81_05325 [Candidatus Buchananbacteria bacterium CG10_big_fil_rev_8_21_14_0_10_42_9]